MIITQNNQDVLLYISDSYNPYFNLAFEQYLATKIFQKKQIPIIFLWRNQKTIVIGKNQVAQFEINLESAKHDNISIVKRMSGGGTVYHDLGNFCFSFIVKNENQAGNYQLFLNPIIDFLQQFQIDAKIKGKNDLAVNEFKISGNAQYIINDVLVHHGTILYNTDLTAIKNYLTVKPIKIQTKVQRSQISQVKNIIEFLKEPIDNENFFQKLIDFFKKNSNYQWQTIDSIEKNEIEILQKKYEKKEWNFNHPFNLEKINEKRFDNGTVTLWLKLNNNIIEKILFEGDFLATKEHFELNQKFIGQIFNLKLIDNILNSIDLEPYFGKITKEQLLSLFE